MSRIVKPADIIIITVALMFSFVTLFVADALGNVGENRICVISVEGKEYARYDLDKIHEDKVLIIENHFGINHIKITSDGVKVTYSDCPNKVEMIDRYINKPGEVLVCMPHRLVIEIIGSDENIDAVSY